MEKIINFFKNLTSIILLFVCGAFIAYFFLPNNQSNLISFIIPFVIGIVNIAVCFIIPKKIIRSVLVYIAFVCFGMAYILLSFHFLYSTPLMKLADDNSKTYFEGCIDREPVVVGNTCYITLKPKFVKLNPRTTQEQVIYFENQYARVLFITPLDKLDKIPLYKDTYQITANMKKLESVELGYVRRLGFKTNVLFKLENGEDFKLDNYHTSWWIEGVNFVRNRISGVIRTNMSPMNAGLFSWLFFGDQNGMPSLFRARDGTLFSLFVFIKSKFYFLFVVIFIFIITGSIGLRRRVFYVLSIPFIGLIALLHALSPEALNVSIVIILFLIVASHYGMGKALYYSLAWSFLIITIYDPYIFSDKWFIYFVVLCLASIFIRRLVDLCFNEFLKGWVILGFVVSLFIIFLSGFFIYFWEYLFLRTALIVLCLGIISLAVVVQKIFPWHGFEYKKMNRIVRQLLSWWFAVYLACLVPLSLYYVDPINISSIVFNIPIIVIFFILIQAGFVGHLIGIFISGFSWAFYFIDIAKGYNLVINELTKLFFVGLKLETIYASGKSIFIFRNNAFVVGFIFLFWILLYIIYRRFSNVSKFYSNKVPILINLLRRVYVISLILFVSAGLLYFVDKKEACTLDLYDTNLGSLVLFHTKSDKDILIADLRNKNLYREQYTFSKYGDLNYFLKKNVLCIDRFVSLNVKDNYMALNRLSFVLKYLLSGSAFTDMQFNNVAEKISLEEFEGIFGHEIGSKVEGWKAYNEIFDFYHQNILVNETDPETENIDHELKGGRLKEEFLRVINSKPKPVKWNLIEDYDSIFEEHKDVSTVVDIFNVSGKKLARISYGLVLIYVVMGDIDTYFLPQPDISKRLAINLYRPQTTDRRPQTVDYGPQTGDLGLEEEKILEPHIKLIIDAPVINGVDAVKNKKIYAELGDISLKIKGISVEIKGNYKLE